eukprot:Gb_26976 [translate_table: standard]
MPPWVQQKVKPIKSESRTERIARWTKEVAGEDIAPRAESLKGMSLNAKTGTPRDESNHVSTSLEETAQADDQALHLEAVNMESTACKNQEEASKLMCQNSKVEKSETSHKRSEEQIPSNRNQLENYNIKGHEEQVPKITELDMAYTWQTPKPNVKVGGGPLVFDIKTQNIKKLFVKLKNQSQEDSIENTTRRVEERLPEDEALVDTQPATSHATRASKHRQTRKLLRIVAGQQINLENGALPYTPYPILGYTPNNMMQYPIPRNAFGFGGMFNTQFPNNGTPSMPNLNSNYGGSNNTSNNSNNGNGGSGSNNNGHNGNDGNNHSGSGNGGNNNNGGNLNRDDIPQIHCPRYMTWGHDARNCPHKDFKGEVCMECGCSDHKMKDCSRNGKTSKLFSRTPNNDENYDVNICTRSEKKMHTKQDDTDFPSPKTEKNRFMAAKEALETAAKEVQAKREAVKKAEEELERLRQEKAQEEIECIK